MINTNKTMIDNYKLGRVNYMIGLVALYLIFALLGIIGLFVFGYKFMNITFKLIIKLFSLNEEDS